MTPITHRCSLREGRDTLRAYEGWFGEIERKAEEAGSRLADCDRRRLAVTAFLLAVLRVPAAEAPPLKTDRAGKRSAEAAGRGDGRHDRHIGRRTA